MKKKIWGSIDTPSLDYVIPKWEIISGKLSDKSERDKASGIYDEIVTSLKGRKPGEKFTVEKSEVKNLRKLALELEKIIEPLGLSVRSAGGTGNNKLYYTKAILGDAIKARLFGTVGDDDRGQIILKQAKVNGIEVADTGEHLNYTREILLITPKGENDRIGAKFPYKEPKVFHNVSKLIEFAKTCDFFYLESSLIKFIGAEGFKKFVDEVSANGTKIIFAPPTDKAFFIDKNNKPIRSNIEALYYAGEKANMITMNETETIHYAGRPLFKASVTGRNDKNLTTAIDLIRKEFRKFAEKLALITVGKHGMIGVTKEFETSVDAALIEKIVNTVGAGDSAAATVAAIIYGGEFKGFSKTLVEKAMKLASKVSAAVIGQNPAQIGVKLVREITAGRIR